MGAITIQIGPLSRSITAADAQMSAVLSAVVETTDGPTTGTAAERVDWILHLIRRYLVSIAHEERQRAAADAAVQAVERVELE